MDGYSMLVLQVVSLFLNVENDDMCLIKDRNRCMCEDIFWLMVLY